MTLMDWWSVWGSPLIAPIVTGAVLTTVAAVWAMIQRRASDRAGGRRITPPTWPEMWDRLEQQEKKIDALEKQMLSRDRAFGNILATIAMQWPTDAPGPVFNKSDLDILGENTVPTMWINRFRRAQST